MGVVDKMREEILRKQTKVEETIKKLKRKKPCKVKKKNKKLENKIKTIIKLSEDIAMRRLPPFARVKSNESYYTKLRQKMKMVGGIRERLLLSSSNQKHVDKYEETESYRESVMMMVYYIGNWSY